LQILLQAVIFDHGKNSARCSRLLDLVKEHAMDLFDGSAPETMQYSKRGEVEKFYNDNIKELKENVNAIKADKPMPEA
jgi:hypothetical protein